MGGGYTHLPLSFPPRALCVVSSAPRNKPHELIPVELAKSTSPVAVVPQTMSSLYLNCVRNCRIKVYRRPISSIRFTSVSLRQLLATILLVCKEKWSRTMKSNGTGIVARRMSITIRILNGYLPDIYFVPRSHPANTCQEQTVVRAPAQGACATDISVVV